MPRNVRISTSLWMHSTLSTSIVNIARALIDRDLSELVDIYILEFVFPERPISRVFLAQSKSKSGSAMRVAMAESTIARRSLASCVVVWVVLFGALAHPSSATDYVVDIKSIGTPGGLRFSQQFSDAVEVLSDATTYIQGAFSESQPKDIPTVTLTVDSFDGVAQTAGSDITLSSDYVASQPADPAKMHFEIEGVLYHETTHVWQNNNGAYGTDKFFTGIIEGVADWVRLTAGFASVGWGPRAKGGNWYDGYTTTAYFLDWIVTQKKPGFVNDLNLKMAQPWSNDFFQQILDQGVDELWTEYQNSI